VVVAVAVVLMVQMAVDEVVHVIPVGDRLVPASGAVHVVGRVAAAGVARPASVGMLRVDRQDVVVQMVAVRVVQVPVVDEVDVALVDDGHVAAARAVDVLVPVGRVAHTDVSVGDPAGVRRA
jgi:hypothetical protein